MPCVLESVILLTQHETAWQSLTDPLLDPLFEMPFSQYNEEGVSGVFPEDDERIRDLLNSVRENALA